MFRRISLLVLSAVIVATVISVPASGANREHQQLMADIRMLQEQTQQLHAQLVAVTDALKAVATKLDDQSGATRKAFADQKLLADGVSGDLRVIREKVDDNNVRISSLSQEIEAVRLAIPQTPPQPAAMTGEIQPGTSPPPATPPGAALGQSPQKLFDTAWGDYTVGQYSLAITGFSNYIKSFPTLDKAGEAQWYIGEAQYGLGNYKDAVAAYDRVISDFPNHRLVPDAYYKRGVALNALGQVDRARESWEFVVKTYPSSDAGRLARQKLDLLIRKSPGLL
ncbi:MAG: tol-pal system protein YbgF [Acidobacteria bacterium]|nr:tol-pal system protein YbgF [Acidobacteriota bacterium]